MAVYLVIKDSDGIKAHFSLCAPHPKDRFRIAKEFAIAVQADTVDKFLNEALPNREDAVFSTEGKRMAFTRASGEASPDPQDQLFLWDKVAHRFQVFEHPVLTKPVLDVPDTEPALKTAMKNAYHIALRLGTKASEMMVLVVSPWEKLNEFLHSSETDVTKKSIIEEFAITWTPATIGVKNQGFHTPAGETRAPVMGWAYDVRICDYHWDKVPDYVFHFKKDADKGFVTIEIPRLKLESRGTYYDELGEDEDSSYRHILYKLVYNHTQVLQHMARCQWRLDVLNAHLETIITADDIIRWSDGTSERGAGDLDFQAGEFYGYPAPILDKGLSAVGQIRVAQWVAFRLGAWPYIESDDPYMIDDILDIWAEYNQLTFMNSLCVPPLLHQAIGITPPDIDYAWADAPVEYLVIGDKIRKFSLTDKDSYTLLFPRDRDKLVDMCVVDGICDVWTTGPIWYYDWNQSEPVAGYLKDLHKGGEFDGKAEFKPVDEELAAAKAFPLTGNLFVQGKVFTSLAAMAGEAAKRGRRIVDTQRMGEETPARSLWRYHVPFEQCITAPFNWRVLPIQHKCKCLSYWTFPLPEKFSSVTAGVEKRESELCPKCKRAELLSALEPDILPFH